MRKQARVPHRDTRQVLHRETLVPWVILLAVAVFLPLAANAQDWTTVGSAGAIDEDSLSTYATTDMALHFAWGASTPASVNAYFNVVNTSGSSIAPWTTLEMESKDGTVYGQITATLYRVPKCGGGAITVCTASSTDATTNVTCTSCTFSGGLDFSNNSYFVKVSLQRTSTVVSPQMYLYHLRTF